MFGKEDSSKMSEKRTWTRERQPAKLPNMEISLYYVLWSIPLAYSYYSIYSFTAGSVLYLSILIHKKQLNYIYKTVQDRQHEKGKIEVKLMTS